MSSDINRHRWCSARPDIATPTPWASRPEMLTSGRGLRHWLEWQFLNENGDTDVRTIIGLFFWASKTLVSGLLSSVENLYVIVD